MLKDDKFLLCYGTSNYIGVTKDQLSLVDADGKLIKKWSNRSSEIKETSNMTHFALDADGQLIWFGVSMRSLDELELIHKCNLLYAMIL